MARAPFVLVLLGSVFDAAMTKFPSLLPEPPALRLQQEMAQQRVAARRAAARARAEGRETAPPPSASPALIPDLGTLAATGTPMVSEPSFDISAESLGDLLARINMSGAGVTARISDATRRVRIASLGFSFDAGGPPLSAELRVTASPYSPVEVAAPGSPASVAIETAGPGQAEADGTSSAAEVPAPVGQEAEGADGTAQVEGGGVVPTKGTLVDVVG